MLKSHVKQFSMGSTRVRFLLNVKLTAFKDQIRGKLDFYDETASYMSLGDKCRFFGFSRQRGHSPTRGPELSPPTAAVNVVGGSCGQCCHSLSLLGLPSPQMRWEQEEHLHLPPPDKRPGSEGFHNSSNKRFLTCFKDCIRPCHLLRR